MPLNPPPALLYASTALVKGAKIELKSSLKNTLAESIASPIIIENFSLKILIEKSYSSFLVDYDCSI